MTNPFHYKPLSEVIAEYEKDPEKKKLLDAEREKAAAWMSSLAEVQPIEFDIYNFLAPVVKDMQIVNMPLLEQVLENQMRYQLAQDIDDAVEQDDKD